MGATDTIKNVRAISAKQIYFALLIPVLFSIGGILFASSLRETKARSRFGRFEMAVESSALRLSTDAILAPDPENIDRIFLKNVERKDWQAALSWLRADSSLHPSGRFQICATLHGEKADNPSKALLIFQADGQGYVGFEPCMNPQLLDRK